MVKGNNELDFALKCLKKKMEELNKDKGNANKYMGEAKLDFKKKIDSAKALASNVGIIAKNIIFVTGTKGANEYWMKELDTVGE